MSFLHNILDVPRTALKYHWLPTWELKKIAPQHGNPYLPEADISKDQCRERWQTVMPEKHEGDLQKGKIKNKTTHTDAPPKCLKGEL